MWRIQMWRGSFIFAPLLCDMTPSSLSRLEWVMSVTHERVMTHSYAANMNESRHIWMCRIWVSHVNHAWVSRVTQDCREDEWVTSRVNASHMNGSSHIWIHHVYMIAAGLSSPSTPCRDEWVLCLSRVISHVSRDALHCNDIDNVM